MAYSLAPPLIVIVGTTASGKTSLAIELAKKFNGEIICADSRTVYKEMNIGTAKPTLSEREEVVHHLLDIVSPNQKFNVAQFQELVFLTIEDVAIRGKLPILVGGSGMYIDSVIFNYRFAGSNAYRDSTNPRHLSPDVPRQELMLRDNTLIFGIDWPKDILVERSENRVRAMIKSGLLQESIMLSERYGWDIPAMRSPAYRSFRGYISGLKTMDKAIADCVVYDGQLARKQRTWFRRNNSIQWVNDPNIIVDLTTTFLNT
ncbi:tRNA dimethylallyltransferase [Candidatus Saccharibacteria bacterium]|nr:tRNA dimethylallyltransferase [Candidatus Saccharibacteria bacterium]